MKFRIIKKISIFLLALICIHFTCYFPVANANEVVFEMQNSASVIDTDGLTCCDHSAGVCHEVGDMSFLNWAGFGIPNDNTVKFISADFQHVFKILKTYNFNSLSNFQLENIKTVEIII